MMRAFGALEARVLEPRAAVTRAVVLCHGFGAPGDNLVWIGDALRREAGLAASTAFVFPAGPLSLESVGLHGSRAWWRFDFLRMAQEGVTGALALLRREMPEGLAPARRQLLALVEQVCRQWSLAPGDVVLGGFSQGAMLATDVALRMEEPPRALAVFSGTLICEEEWTRRAPTRRGLRVLQTHGRRDPLLPFAGALALRDLLVGAGLSVDFHAFDGAHTVGEVGLREFRRLLLQAPRE
jgi:phospholipase/carboxylesterase